MSNKFKPGLHVFEDRVVPAAFSFQFADGTIGSGVFSTPVEFDPDEPLQTVPVSDLTVTVGGVEYTPQSGVTADYLDGRLIGVTGSATGPGGVLQLDGDRVNLGGDSVSGEYDGATTQATFVLKHPVTEAAVGRGAISYDIPWELVDRQLPSQSLNAVNFKLNIAGQNLSEGMAGFTSPPMLVFELGVLTGVTFDVNTASVPDFRFTRISSTGSTVSADDPVTGTTLNADVDPVGLVSLDFTTVQGNSGVGVIDAGTITTTVKLKGVDDPIVSTVTFGRGFGRDALASLVARDLYQRGLTTVKSTTNILEFSGKVKNALESVDVVITNNSGPAGGKSKEVQLKINGVER